MSSEAWRFEACAEPVIAPETATPPFAKKLSSSASRVAMVDLQSLPVDHQPAQKMPVEAQVTLHAQSLQVPYLQHLQPENQTPSPGRLPNLPGHVRAGPPGARAA